jgi:TetR/AcrR family transcriptional regulator, ethionamide resistance regulator
MKAAREQQARRLAAQRNSRRDRRDQARAQVMRTALELAEQSPFRDLTVDEIARAAGFSRSSFYLHFRDKHELLLTAVEEIASELAAMADRAWHAEGPPADRVRRAVAGVVRVYAENANLIRLAIEVSTYDEEVRHQWREIVQRLIATTARHIRSEQRAGLVPRALEPEGTAESLVWMAERYCYVYLGRAERTPEEVVAALTSVWAATLYPGVIPARELRPGGSGAGPWGMDEPRWTAPEN